MNLWERFKKEISQKVSYKIREEFRHGDVVLFSFDPGGQLPSIGIVIPDDHNNFDPAFQKVLSQSGETVRIWNYFVTKLDNRFL